MARKKGGKEHQDAPHHQGEWQRQTSGLPEAQDREGMAQPSERSWSEDQVNPERRSGGDRRAASGGLRGYRKPDESLAREIHEILTKDPELDATEIEVEVEGGAVTLTGEVESSDAKLLAEELVESTPGVREVHNRLRIAR
jgi:osmotically-inducible protein OsmY